MKKGSLSLVIPGNKQHTPVEVHLKEDVISIFKHQSLSSSLLDDEISADEPPQACSKELLMSIKFCEIIGCHRMKGLSHQDNSAYFAVYSYPKVKIGRFNNPLTNRIRHVHTFQVSGNKRYEDNSREAAVWVEEIRKFIPYEPPPHKREVLASKQRCLYVLVNPHGGPGKALDIFQNQVLPVLAEANAICKLVITERADHAKVLAQRLDLNIWDGLVIVSGDGLIFEVLNGFMLRDDRDDALKMPLGIIPGGSGNALASSICYSFGESILGQFALQAAVMVARPRYTPMKLIHVETETDHFACFMGVAWGIISDIDIESEMYRRCLGGARFFWYAIVRCCCMRVYRARVSFLRYEGETPPESSHGSRSISGNRSEIQGMSNSVFQREEDDDLYRWESTEKLPHVEDTESFTVVDRLKENQFLKEVEFVDENLVRNSNENHSTSASKLEEVERKRAFWSRRHVAKNIPPLSEEVPEDWTVIEDDFVTVVGVFMSHLGHDIIFMPQSTLNDGIIYLCLIRGTASRVQVAKVMSNFSSGQHVSHDCFEIIPVRAYRLEPLGENKGIITVDGEIANTSKVQVSTTYYCANVMGR